MCLPKVSGRKKALSNTFSHWAGLGVFGRIAAVNALESKNALNALRGSPDGMAGMGRLYANFMRALIQAKSEHFSHWDEHLPDFRWRQTDLKVDLFFAGRAFKRFA